MIRTNEFRKFFMYVLMDYCEDTCTDQDDLYNFVLMESSMDTLFNSFAEEGFMEWYPSDFNCLGGASDGSVDTFTNLYDDDDPRGMPCVEQFWLATCDKSSIDFNSLIEIM